ncbi:MAG TPA: hypothetical protein VFS15_06235, partial [Kofleriaceae bacterium]|nr:hypothetical protein [Kofleriaceae bacterium]
LRECCPLNAECEHYLKVLVEEKQAMSARAIDRLIKVARTLADLDGKDAIDRASLVEAVQYRAVDPTTDVFVAPAAEKVPTPDELAAARTRLPALPAPP